MVEQTNGGMNKTGSPSPQGFEKAAASGRNVADQAKSVADQALSAGREFKDKAKDIADSSADVIKDRTSELVDAAKDMASQATGKLQETLQGQKQAGAEYVGSLADTMRRAAREFDADLPIAGAYIRKAASQIEGVSDSIKTGNFNDLVQGAQSFARRQPTAFLGIAVLAGFGVVRFLKSSANQSDTAGSGSGRTGGERQAPGAVNHSFADNARYSR